MKTFTESDPMVAAIFDAANHLEGTANGKWEALLRAGRIAALYMGATKEGDFIIPQPTVPSSPREDT